MSRQRVGGTTGVTRLKGQDLLTLADLEGDDIYQLLAKSLELKRRHRMGVEDRMLAGRTVAMIFEKPSTRTRVSFEAGAAQLGASSIFLGSEDLQLARGETVEDTGAVLSRYVDAIVLRTFGQERVEALASAASVPVINALSDKFHPCQALADLLTMLERKDRLAGLHVAYVGDGNNVCNSLMIGCAKVGANISVAAPHGYEPEADVVELVKTIQRGPKDGLLVTDDPREAVERADVVYTDVWVSMGQDEERAKRLADLEAFRVDAALMKSAKRDAIFLHCLPAHRGEEVTAEVIDGPQSAVFDEAENRLHVQKALLVSLLG